jgi:hypothetical protein
MKRFLKLSALALARLALLIAVLLAAVLLPTPPAKAATITFVGDPAPTAVLSNTMTISGHVYTNIVNSTDIPLVSGRGVSLDVRWTGTSLANTNTVGVAFAPSQDGTSFVNNTNAYYWVLFSPKGSTTAVALTNLPATLVDNYKYLRAVQTTNNTLASTNMAATLQVYWNIR